MLDVSGVSAGYGSLEILHDVSLELREGEWLALLGASGSGKTTLLKTIVGLLEPSRGAIRYRGEPLRPVASHDRVKRGLAMVPEGRRLFTGMSVRENLLAGAFTVRDAQERRALLARVFALFPVLRERENQVVGTASGGEQQMCAIGRALMSRPKLMIIDELSLGLAPLVVKSLVEALGQIRAAGTTLLVVEQDVRLALTLADRACIMRQGRIVRSGRAADLLEDPRLQQDFLGF